MQTNIRHTWFFHHEQEKVWDYLTQPELIEKWLMKNNFKPIIGHQFHFKTTPMPNFNFNGIIDCKVLEIVPCQKLSYSWQGGAGDGTIGLDSIVEWILTAKDGGTELQLTHSGFKETDVMMHSIMSDGWDKNVQKITQLLNTTTA